VLRSRECQVEDSDLRNAVIGCITVQYIRSSNPKSDNLVSISVLQSHVQHYALYSLLKDIHFKSLSLHVSTNAVIIRC
jgi:hypothetical protein